MTQGILAIDLGKYKSVACAYRAGREPGFATLASNPEAFPRLCQRHRPGVVVIEARLLAGWVHDLCVGAGFACKAANTASDAWKFKHSKRETDRDGAAPACDPLPTTATRSASANSSARISRTSSTER
jgi:hypothetical protein